MYVCVCGRKECVRVLSSFVRFVDEGDTEVEDVRFISSAFNVIFRSRKEVVVGLQRNECVLVPPLPCWLMEVIK